jgi:hypothetical protein
MNLQTIHNSGIDKNTNRIYFRGKVPLLAGPSFKILPIRKQNELETAEKKKL